MKILKASSKAAKKFGLPSDRYSFFAQWNNNFENVTAFIIGVLYILNRGADWLEERKNNNDNT